MKRLLVVGVMAVLLAACGSDGAAVANTASPPVPTSVAVTTAATATSAPTPTAAATTTTTATSTTLPATTTTTVSTESLIKQAIQDYFVAYESCGAAPATCVAENFTAAQGHSRSTITELATGMAAQGLYFSTDLNGSYIVAESISSSSPTEVTSVSCWFDAGIVLGPVGPDSNPTVVDNLIVSYRYKLVLYLEDTDWRVGEQLDVEHLGEGNLCPAAA